MLTVEKIGGTSMSKFEDVLNNIIYLDEKKAISFNRIFVVSAYGGITNQLLENKKTGAPGIYQRFANAENFEPEFAQLLVTLKELNKDFGKIGLNVTEADAFIEDRLAQIKNFLNYMAELIASGYVERNNILFSARELLASVGEVHSAYNSANICRNNGINAEFIDLSGFCDTRPLTMEERIAEAFGKIDLSKCIAIATGYAKSDKGIMREFDRGYSEVTFSKIAVELNADEAIIHKEYHLSSSDPNVVGVENAIPVGFTNYDVADQLADVGMEAIHPKASKPLELKNINLRIKNTFEPKHPGTLITKGYRSEKSKIEIITGSEKILLIDIHDSNMVGEVGTDLKIMRVLQEFGISYILKATNANSITLAVWDNKKVLPVIEKLQSMFEDINTKQAAIVSIIGSNIAMPGILQRVTRVLYENGINVDCISQSLRQTNIQVIIERAKYTSAIKALNMELIMK